MTLRIRKWALSLGSLVLAAGLLTLVTPRRAHAVASALVQLTNTLTNPAIAQDVSRMAGPMLSLICFPVPSGQTTNACVEMANENQTYTTPANQSFVVTSVDITGSSSATYNVSLVTPGAQLNYWIGSGGNTTHFDYPQGIVVPPSTTPYLFDITDTHCPTVVLHGYLTYQ